MAKKVVKEAGSRVPATKEVYRVSNTSEVIESYIFASSSRDLSLYSERLLMKLVSIAQSQVRDSGFKGERALVSIGALGEARVEIPIKDLLGPHGTNYTLAKESIKELMRCPQFIERPKHGPTGRVLQNDKGETEYEFIGFNLLNSCFVNVKPGVAIIEVNRETWCALLDFSKGFRRYDLELAMELKSSASLRLYRLLANVTSPITYSLEVLRKMWGLDVRDPETGEYVKYKDTKSFIQKIIKVGQTELDNKSAWTFDYICNYSKVSGESGRSRRVITSITFIPVHDESKEKKLDYSEEWVMRDMLGRELYNCLRNKFGFTDKGISNNARLFETARDVGMDVFDFLMKNASLLLRRVRSNMPAYIIGAIKNHLTENYGVVFENGVDIEEKSEEES